MVRSQLGDDPTKDDVKTFTEKTLSSGKVRTVLYNPSAVSFFVMINACRAARVGLPKGP